MAKGDVKSLPLRHGMEDKLPKKRSGQWTNVVYPSVGQEVRDIRAGEFQVYEIPGCEEYRCLIAPDPRGQYKALVVKEKRMPGVMKDTWFWSPIRANPQTGPVIRGFDDTLLALAFSQEWLIARVQGKIRTEASRKAFINAKKKEKSNHYEKSQRQPADPKNKG